MMMISGLVLAVVAGVEAGDKAGRNELKQMKLVNAQLADVNRQIESMK
ncbi:hypothetical protein [Periweissella fabalis]|uniref:Uncharacterized protein n=1 Tax=Periweissella fabalis TaxID=1070421 RepID=A0A7X6N6I4_9LACO|nr:hypothetical protein [Periweissella fabalis]MCM0598306.1 hypothetical protein [Periweissella fabalis]NKZ24938.1 hypothetical protein [Periweissella fabalis]